MRQDNLTVASFFSGVGLLDLGLEWSGFRTVSFSEIDPYASRILALRYPGVPNLGDIHGITDVPPATLWAGGFPCQPVSTAGKRRAQGDARWLWPRWMDLIRASRPRYLLLENVSNLLAVNDGAAFGDVLRDLATGGYDAEWDCIPAAALGAPHLRDRVWIVGRNTDRDHEATVRGARGWEDAEPGRGGHPVPDAERIGVRQQPVAIAGRVGQAIAVHDGEARPVADAESPRVGRLHPRSRRPIEAATDAHRPRSLDHADGGRRQPGSEGPLVWRLPQPDPRRHGSGDGWWGAEPRLGRVVDGCAHRVDRLRCLGNGVVPQVAEFIGWRLRAVIEADLIDRAWLVAS